MDESVDKKPRISFTDLKLTTNKWDCTPQEFFKKQREAYLIRESNFRNGLTKQQFNNLHLFQQNHVLFTDSAFKLRPSLIYPHFNKLAKTRLDSEDEDLFRFLDDSANAELRKALDFYSRLQLPIIKELTDQRERDKNTVTKLEKRTAAVELENSELHRKLAEKEAEKTELLRTLLLSEEKADKCHEALTWALRNQELDMRLYESRINQQSSKKEEYVKKDELGKKDEIKRENE